MKPTKPALWTVAKRKARATTEGSPKGRWSRRKAALAKLEYRKRGGAWVQSASPPKRSS